jgi:type IV secretion system protein VirB8
MNAMPPKAKPDGAFLARPVSADPAVLEAYFAQVKSFESDRLRGAERSRRAAWIVAGVAAMVAAAACVAVASLAPLKTVVPLAFRVDNTTGAVERVFDVRAGEMEATEAVRRHFLWEYVRHRQSYSPAEAESNFNAVGLTSSATVQQLYAEGSRGSNPNSPQVLLGKDGEATVRWLATSFLGDKLAQVRFEQTERKGLVALPPRRMIATIAFEFAPGKVADAAINVNPLGFVVTSYRVDQEAGQ